MFFRPSSRPARRDAIFQHFRQQIFNTSVPFFRFFIHPPYVTAFPPSTLRTPQCNAAYSTNFPPICTDIPISETYICCACIIICQNMNHFSLPVKRAMRTVHSTVTSSHTAVRHIENHNRRTQRQAERRAHRFSGVIHRLMILSVNPNEVPFELLTHGVQDIPTFCLASSRHGLPANRPITSFTGSTRKATMLPNTFELHSV